MGWFIGIACIAALIIIVALGVISIKENAEEAAAKEAANRPMTSYGGRKITDTCECCGEHKETKLYLENGKTVREYCKVCADAARADGYVSLQVLNVVKPVPDTPKNPDSSFPTPEPPEKPRKRVKIKKGTIIALCVVAAVLIAVVTLTVVFRRQISGFVYEKTGKCFYHIYYLKDDNSITYTQRAGDTKYHDVTYDYVCDICGKEIIETKKQKHTEGDKYQLSYSKFGEDSHFVYKTKCCDECGKPLTSTKKADDIQPHVYGPKLVQKATCGEYGGTYQECVRCHEKIWIDKEFVYHEYGKLGRNDRSPICQNCGKKAEGLFTLQLYYDSPTYNGGYYYFYGKVANYSSSSITFLKAKLTVFDDDDNIIYTDYTYVNSSVPLLSGEAKTFHLMVRESSIKTFAWYRIEYLD